MYNKFLSYLIREIRNKKKLTQKELALLIDKSEISIRKYENGKNKISFSTLFLVVALLEIPLFELRNFFLEFSSNNLLEDKETIFLEDQINELLGKEEFKNLLSSFNDDLNKIFRRQETKKINIIDATTYNVINDNLNIILEVYIRQKFSAKLYSLYRLNNFLKDKEKIEEKRKFYKNIVESDETVRKSIDKILKQIKSFTEWLINEDGENLKNYVKLLEKNKNN